VHQENKIRRARILVADDDFQVRQRFTKRLQSVGYEAVGVASGKAALTQLHASRFDVLVLDLDMPDLNGFEMLQKVRSELPHVRVLVVSEYLQGALLEAARLFGAASTLDKAKAKKALIEETHRLVGDAA
jgi:CheY-like chemotaxis protein